MNRSVLVRPANCGHNTSFVAEIGDWTWDAVTAQCGTDVLNARDATGAPTYLSFYYYRIRGSRRFHLRTPSFGDRLSVASQVYDFGSESVLVLHRILRTPAGQPDGPPVRGSAGGSGPGPFDPDDFYAFADDEVLSVETFNRWVSRGRGGSNEDLVRASPVDFRHRHLPELPARYSPRHATHLARTALTFLDLCSGGYQPVGGELRHRYEIDPARDLNGVGLLYFAAYFAIVDQAVLRLWRHLGREDNTFLGRVVVDQQLCYLGNADAGAMIEVTTRRWRRSDGDRSEYVNVVLRERDRLLAVCTLKICAEEELA